MKKIMCLIFAVGCVSVPKPTPTDTSPNHKYKVGDCLMLVDPATGNKPTRHRVRVEKIDLRLKRYWYRWLLDNGKWDSELSSAVGKFEVLEKITQKVSCPSLEVVND